MNLSRVPVEALRQHAEACLVPKDRESLQQAASLLEADDRRGLADLLFHVDSAVSDDILAYVDPDLWEELGYSPLDKPVSCARYQARFSSPEETAGADLGDNVGHMPKSHPLQSIVQGDDGLARFQSNAIVEFLLKVSGYDMVRLSEEGFSASDWEQFAQLIGYSLRGFSELGYVRDETVAAAEAMLESGINSDRARADRLQAELDGLRRALRGPIARLYGKHPDDLLEE